MGRADILIPALFLLSYVQSECLLFATLNYIEWQTWIWFSSSSFLQIPFPGFHSMGPFCPRACLSFSSCPNNLSWWPQDKPPSLWKWKANLSPNFPCAGILQTCALTILHFLCLWHSPSQFPGNQWVNFSLGRSADGLNHSNSVPVYIGQGSDPCLTGLNLPLGKDVCDTTPADKDPGAAPRKAGGVLAPVSPRGRKWST